MKTVEMPAHPKEFEKALRDAQRETLVLMRRGKPFAAVVPLQGADAETLSLSTSRRFLSILRRSFKQLDAGRAISLVEMRRRVLGGSHRATRSRAR